MRKFSLSDKNFERINNTFVLIITLIIIYPLIFVISASISDPQAVDTGKMWLRPVDVTFDGFRRGFQNEAIWVGYKNTIIYTIVGTAIHVFLLLPCAYAFSRKVLMAKKFFLLVILFTMLFNVDLVPTFVVVNSLQIASAMWAIVVPGVIGAWVILLAR